MVVLCLACVLPVYGGDALAQPIERTLGHARVVDGDTIEIGTVRIRLWGIDAPETGQQCAIAATTYRCGQTAASTLAALIGAREVECTWKSRDRYGRPIAICRAGGLDLGAEMVRSGWALAFVKYSSDYVLQENEARRARRGLWAGSFMPPSEWRHR